MMTIVRRINTFLFTPHRLYAAALLRVGLGGITALFYLMHLQQREFVWGPSGQLDWAYYKEFITRGTSLPLDLYGLSSTQTWSEFMFWAGLGVTVLYMFGVMPRLTSILFYVSTFSIFNRNYDVLDGGQNLTWLLAFYLCFADTGRHLAIFTLSMKPLGVKAASFASRMGAMLHNAAMAGIVLQVAIVYFWSGFYKVMGHKWDDGTAIYYIMRDREFTLPGISEHIFTNGTLVTLATYGTWMFECSFPFMLWFPKLRPWYFAIAVVLHSSIGVFMGLVMFSSTMIVADLCIFSDAFFVDLIAKTHRALARIGAMLGRPNPGEVLPQADSI